MPDLYTLGQISTQTGLPMHTVRYIVESRKIEPVGRIGGKRVFDDAAVEAVKRAGEKIARDRARRMA